MKRISILVSLFTITAVASYPSHAGPHPVSGLNDQDIINFGVIDVLNLWDINDARLTGEIKITGKKWSPTEPNSSTPLSTRFLLNSQNSTPLSYTYCDGGQIKAYKRKDIAYSKLSDIPVYSAALQDAISAKEINAAIARAQSQCPGYDFEVDFMYYTHTWGMGMTLPLPVKDFGWRFKLGDPMWGSTSSLKLFDYVDGYLQIIRSF